MGGKFKIFSDDEFNVDSQKDTTEMQGISECSELRSNSDTQEFDFSKMFKFFKKKEKQSDQHSEPKERSQEETKEFNIKTFISSPKLKKYAFVLLILIPLIIAFQLRMLPADLPVTEVWAKNNVDAQIRQNIQAQITPESPNLPTKSLNREVDRRFKGFQNSEQNRAQYDQLIDQTASTFRTYMQDEDGQTYLMAVDPYFYARRAKNLIENDHPGDIIKDGKPWNDHMLAPTGKEEKVDLNILLINYLYKFLNPITGKSVMAVAFLIPVLIGSLAVIPAFFLGRKIGGNAGGFFSALLVGIHPVLIARTVGGLSDTDAFNYFFPLIIMWMLIEAFYVETTKLKIVYGSFAGLFIGIFSFAWYGWWYIFDLFIGVFCALILYYLIFWFYHSKINKTKVEIKSKLKPIILTLIIFAASSLIFVTLISNFDNFSLSVRAPLDVIKIKEVSIIEFWPNVYTTVSELGDFTISNIINSLSVGFFSGFLFLLSLLGILFTVLKKDWGKREFYIIGSAALYYLLYVKKFSTNPNTILNLILLLSPMLLILIYNIYYKEDLPHIKYGLILLFWFAITIYASTSGKRFILLLAPVYSIALGLFLGIGGKKLYDLINSYITINKKIVSVSLIVVGLVLIGTFPVSLSLSGTDCPFYPKTGLGCMAHGTALGAVPRINDAWVNSLEYIKTNSEEDAIINSWWDFGHWFKFFSDRAVTFDGASQNRPPAHWIGKTLLTNNETVAIGILKMLDCGGNKTFDLIDERVNFVPKSIDIVNSIIIEDKTEASKILKTYKFTDNEITNILENSHCEPPEDFFIASNDMVEKGLVWAHFGSWDFYKSAMYKDVESVNRNEGIQILVEKYNLTEDLAETYYGQIKSTPANQWISPWPSYVTPDLISCSTINDTVTCDYNYVIERGQVDTVLFSFNYDLKLGNATATIITLDSGTRKLVKREEKSPQSLRLITKDRETYKEYENSTLEFSFVLVENDDGSFNSLATPPLLESSIFTRMYFLNGHNLKYFDLVDSQFSFNGKTIYVYKVDWEGKSKADRYRTGKRNLGGNKRVFDNSREELQSKN